MNENRRQTNNKSIKLNRVAAKLRRNIKTVATSPKDPYKLLESMDRNRKDPKALYK